MERKDIGFLFDLDGVLIDSEKEYSRMWALINQEYPTKEPSLEKVIKGTTLDIILSTYYPDAEIQRNVKTRLYEMEDQMNYEYLPGAREFLSSLREKSLKCALVTSSNDKKMKHLDDELPELRGMFDYIVTADQITKSKPDPEGYLLAAQKLGMTAKDCIVFEDSYQGVKAGKSSGAYVVGVKGTVDEALLAEYADIIVETLAEISLDKIIELLPE